MLEQCVAGGQVFVFILIALESLHFRGSQGLWQLASGHSAEFSSSDDTRVENLASQR